MTRAPILFALRDLTRATKWNAWNAMVLAGDAADWSILLDLEYAAFGNLKLEHDLWVVLQEPWIGVDRHSRAIVQILQTEDSIQRLRLALEGFIRDRRSFVALAFPSLVDHAVGEGYQVQRIAPTVAQIQAFTSAEHAHHLACTFPLAPERWGEGAAPGAKAPHAHPSGRGRHGHR